MKNHAVCASTLEAIGNTPVVQLRTVVPPNSTEVLVITVCDSAAENCLMWSGRRVHLGFPDPAKATGTEEVMAVFRAVRDDIAAKLPALLECVTA